MDVLVTYDIADTEGAGRRRLQRVAQVCSSYGVRVQFSVFECRVSPERLARMTGELADVIDPAIDSVMIYRFAGNVGDSRQQLGRPIAREPDDPWFA